MTGWTPDRDAEMLRLINAGKSATQVGKIMGVSRNSVIGRKHRLARTVFPSQIAREERERTNRRIRLDRRNANEKAAVQVLRDHLAAGLPRGVAIGAARAVGATYRAIGETLGISRQRVEQLTRAI